MPDQQQQFEPGDAAIWHGSPPIYEDDPFPLKVAKRLMDQTPSMYVRQPDGTWMKMRCGLDYDASGKAHDFSRGMRASHSPTLDKP